VTALFVPDGDALLPTDLARGPWNPAALHGGPTSALLARDDPLVAPVPPPEPGPAGSRRERSAIADDCTAFHNAAVEHRFATGSWLDPGPVVVWIRFLAPVVEGEDPSPLERTAAAADFGNGVSFVLPWETHTFINPELTVHLLRPARGERIALDAQSFIGPDGIGLAESALSDEWGRIGRASQSVLVDELEPPPG
jgi:hypothetical protein